MIDILYILIFMLIDVTINYIFSDISGDIVIFGLLVDFIGAIVISSYYIPLVWETLMRHSIKFKEFDKGITKLTVHRETLEENDPGFEIIKETIVGDRDVYWGVPIENLQFKSISLSEDREKAELKISHKYHDLPTEGTISLKIESISRIVNDQAQQRVHRIGGAVLAVGFLLQIIGNIFA